MMFCRNIRPPVPWRYTDPARQIKNSIGSSTTVTAGNHKRAIHAGKRMFHHSCNGAFPLAFDRRSIELSAGTQFIEQWRVINRPENDQVFRMKSIRMAQYSWPFPRNLLYVACKCVSHERDSGKIFTVYIYRSSLSPAIKYKVP